MDVLHRTLQAHDAAAISRFRQLHVSRMMLNVARLGIVVRGLMQLHL